MDFLRWTDFCHCGLHRKWKPCGVLKSERRGGRQTGCKKTPPKNLLNRLVSLHATKQTPGKLTRTTNPSRDESGVEWKHWDVDFVFNLYLFREKLLNMQSPFQALYNRSHNGAPRPPASIQLLCTLLEFTCLSHLNIMHFLLFPEPDFHSEYMDWSWCSSSYKPHG